MRRIKFTTQPPVSEQEAMLKALLDAILSREKTQPIELPVSE